MPWFPIQVLELFGKLLHVKAGAIHGLSPGFQPPITSLSKATCSMSCSFVSVPVQRGLQQLRMPVPWETLPSNTIFISAGGKCQLGLTGKYMQAWRILRLVAVGTFQSVELCDRPALYVHGMYVTVFPQGRIAGGDDSSCNAGASAHCSSKERFRPYAVFLRRAVIERAAASLY